MKNIIYLSFAVFSFFILSSCQDRIEDILAYHDEPVTRSQKEPISFDYYWAGGKKHAIQRIDLTINTKKDSRLRIIPCIESFVIQFILQHIHAAGDTKRGADGCEYRHGQLDDVFPKFTVFHSS